VHKRAKADHAQTCQLLEDSEAAILDARAQHHKALEKVRSVAVKLMGEGQQGKAQRAAIAEFARQRDQVVDALKKKHGL
jgi:hypothetical protein